MKVHFDMNALKIFLPKYQIHIDFSRHLSSVDNELLRVPSFKTNIFENSFTITAAKQWNELPLEVRNSSCLPRLRTRSRCIC